MANEILSQGTILQVETTTPGTFVAVGGVQGFDFPGIERPDIDVTALDSTANEYIGSLPDTGESSFTIFARKASGTAYEAGQERLLTLGGTGAIVPFKAIAAGGFSTGNTWTCNGYVKSIRLKPATKEATVFECTIRWTGAPVRS